MSIKPPLTIRLCQPRGFCAGVDRAIQIVVLALKKYGAPVYVRHEIVHNRYVVEGLQKLGAVFIEELHEIPAEHRACPVVFSAHGVPKSVPADAQARKLFYLDATCPLVSKVHKQAMRHQRLGRHVAADRPCRPSGGDRHDGPAARGRRHADRDRGRHRGASTPADPEALGFVTQTTLSVEDTAGLIRGAAAEVSGDHRAGRRIDLLRHHQPPGSGEGSGRRRRSLSRRRRAELVQFHASRRGRRAGGREDVASRAARRRHPVGRDRRRSRRSACRQAPPRRRSSSTRSSTPSATASTSPSNWRSRQPKRRISRSCSALRDVVLTPADMAFVNGALSV